MRLILVILLFVLAFIGILFLRVYVEFMLSAKLFELNERGSNMIGSMVQVTLMFALWKCASYYREVKHD